MQLSDFDFALPPELIAQTPAEQRSASRLLHVNGLHRSDLRFDALPGLLKAGDLLVLNDTRVIKARLLGAKVDTGGNVEALIERVTDEHEALAQLRVSKTPRPGTRLRFGAATAQVLGRADQFFRLRFDAPVLAVLASEGHTPLPPYIEHPAAAVDDHRYQTVYARSPGSVAAPTAGLHFDEPLLDALRTAGIGISFVTLHVGAGTFQPVRADDVREHRMHAERYELPADAARDIAAARARGGRIVAVGTTAVRTLESAALAAGDGQPLAACSGETTLFVTPGYRFRLVDAMITNFHLPRSTLFMLVCAFGGTQALKDAYAHAIAARYRFFSYGDAMLIERDPAAGGPAPAASGHAE